MQLKPLQAGLVLVIFGTVGLGQTRAQDGLIGKFDLSTSKGVEAVKGEWRFAPVMTGVGDKRNDIEPKAHGVFDDSKWEVLKPETLSNGRGPGAYSWAWYRTKLTIPDEVDGKKFEGGPVWLQATIDDYGEVWVDGKLDPGAGRGSVQGYNVKNRVRLQKVDTDDKKQTITRDAKPGDVFQIAVLAINGPLATPGGIYFLHKPINLEFFTKDARKDGADTPRTVPVPSGTMIAEIDLLSKEGVEAVKGPWRRHLLSLHTGARKNDFEPRAHGQFDDSKWEAVAPADLTKGFGPGKFSMAWYRIQITIPEKVKMRVNDKEVEVDVKGATVWFRTTVEHYGEVLVDGGSSGGSNVGGIDTPNVVRLNAKAGQTIQIAILAMNGPFGNPPESPLRLGPTVLQFFVPNK